MWSGLRPSAFFPFPLLARLRKDLVLPGSASLFDDHRPALSDRGGLFAWSCAGAGAGVSHDRISGSRHALNQMRNNNAHPPYRTVQFTFEATRPTANTSSHRQTGEK
ncbi:uncharacterized protein BO66DRAFT_389432 [Aspergillus aculeatinus CBS 121060]|uniref:Uncharacterized protein n=1 Tax=Aspergillus aculeatinus CBS 121060 TaxID=1448322 RepID=A0ACD1HGZ1_9EURO|nr:hypothetical protein BO66DRAFT_389432 [Aspergillus aculeatinus CBS 121060]RAH72860.1 hypothetical protein BO66DRAFT_389432 [Aspergillus aculeatinus CBS 121060]